MLTENQVLKFRKIYKEKYGKDISKKEAYEQGIKLVGLMQTVINLLEKEIINNEK